MMLITKLLIERPARRQDWTTVRATLIEEQQTIFNRMIAARLDEKNRAAMIALVALERWVFAHLSGASGAGDLDRYRPDESASQETLTVIFRETRDGVIGLVDQIIAGKAQAAGLNHVRFGALSAKGALYALRAHTNMESKKLR